MSRLSFHRSLNLMEPSTPVFDHYGERSEVSLSTRSMTSSSSLSSVHHRESKQYSFPKLHVQQHKWSPHIISGIESLLSEDPAEKLEWSSHAAVRRKSFSHKLESKRPMRTLHSETMREISPQPLIPDRESFFYKLKGHSMEGTQVYSPSRYPLPRCHPGTRVSLVEEITSWVSDTLRSCNALWLHGPAGVGKTAVAQTMAESAYDSPALGAAVFLSQTGNRNDTSRFWTSISLDLARHNIRYRQAIEKHAHDNEAVLAADLRTQFYQLIVQMLSGLMDGEEFLIIIDGLDECRKEEQCEIVECICNALRSQVPLPIIWMICSRPEAHLKRVFRKAESEGLCWAKELLVDDPEARSDVERYLRDEFQRIAERYGNSLGRGRNWPPKGAFDKIVNAASGLFILATTIIRFISARGSNPQSQLEAVITFLDGTSPPSSMTNPLAYVDKLYLDILERSQPDILPFTLRLLGICVVCPPLPLLHLAQFLEFNLDTLYTALLSVHSIIEVPSHEDTIEKPLRYYHASFPEFLVNPNRSGRFSQEPEPHHSHIAKACFRVLGNTKVSYAESLTWDFVTHLGQANPSNLSVSHTILTFAATHVWDICTRIQSPELEFIRNTLACFDYRSLQSIGDVIPGQSFVCFLRWLYSLTRDVQDLSDLIRTNSCSDLDDQFIERCIEISQPLALESKPGGNELKEFPCYVLIGFGLKTILAFIIPDGVMVYSVDDIGFL